MIEFNFNFAFINFRAGKVNKIVTFKKNGVFQCLIQFDSPQSAHNAKQLLNGQNIFNCACTLRIEFSKLQTLNVKFNNEKSRDFTNPALPSGQEGPAGGQPQHGQPHGQVGAHGQPAAHHALAQLQSDALSLLTPPFSPIHNQSIAGPTFALSPLHALSMAHLAQTNQSSVLLVSNLNEQVSQFNLI